jgi:hypothetical protein
MIENLVLCLSGQYVNILPITTTFSSINESK